MGGRGGAWAKFKKAAIAHGLGSLPGIGGSGGGSSGGIINPISSAAGSGWGAGTPGGGPMSGFPGYGQSGAGISGTASSQPDSQFGQDPQFSGFVEFHSYSDAYAWHEAHNFNRDQWDNVLTAEEREGIYRYTGSSYGAMNTPLREQTTPETRVVPYIYGAKSGLSKTVNAEDCVVYRGTCMHWAENLLGASPSDMRDPKFLQSRIGARVIDRGFMSTAVTKDDAWGADVTLKIYNRKGTHGMYVDPISMNRGEKEFLLNADTQFIVHSITTDSSGTVEEIVLETVVP